MTKRFCDFWILEFCEIRNFGQSETEFKEGENRDHVVEIVIEKSNLLSNILVNGRWGDTNTRYVSKKIRFRENIIINLEKKVIWIFFLLVDFSKSIILSKTRQLGLKSVVFVRNFRFWKVHILELNPEKTQLEKTKLEKTGKVTLVSKNWWMGRFQTLYPRKTIFEKLNILKFGFSRLQEFHSKKCFWKFSLKSIFGEKTFGSTLIMVSY